MEIEHVLMVIIAAAALFLFATIFLGLTEEAKGGFRTPGRIVVDNKPGAEAITIGSGSFVESGAYEYSSVSIYIMAKYSGELKEDLEVVPVISFKGVDKKATITEASGATSEFFTLTKTRPEMEGTLEAKNIVGEPPIRGFVSGRPTVEIKEPYPINYKETVALSMEGKGTTGRINFIIKLHDIGYPLAGNLCRATFAVECHEQRYFPALFEKAECDKTGDMSKCQAVMNMCNSIATLTANRLDCQKRQADIEFQLEPGEYNYPFEVGEKIGVTFFKKSTCTNQDKSLKLIKDCAGQEGFLGGTYIFVKPLPSLTR